MEHIIGRLLQDYERGKMTRRQLIQTLAITATAASTAEAAAPANAIHINHVSMQVADYTKTRDWYSGLFGMKVTNDDGKTQCRLTFGDNIVIARNAILPPFTARVQEQISARQAIPRSEFNAFGVGLVAVDY